MYPKGLSLVIEGFFGLDMFNSIKWETTETEDGWDRNRGVSSKTSGQGNLMGTTNQYSGGRDPARKKRKLLMRY